MKHFLLFFLLLGCTSKKALEEKRISPAEIWQGCEISNDCLGIKLYDYLYEECEIDEEECDKLTQFEDLFGAFWSILMKYLILFFLLACGKETIHGETHIYHHEGLENENSHKIGDHIYMTSNDLVDSQYHSKSSFDVVLPDRVLPVLFSAGGIGPGTTLLLDNHIDGERCIYTYKDPYFVKDTACASVMHVGSCIQLLIIGPDRDFSIRFELELI